MNSDNEFQPPTKLKIMRKKGNGKMRCKKYMKAMVPSQSTSDRLDSSDFDMEEGQLLLSSKLSSNIVSPPSSDDELVFTSLESNFDSTPCHPQKEKEVVPVTLESNSNNRTYLMTYAQADRNAFPTRESFGQLCELAFGGESKVTWYAVGSRQHACVLYLCITDPGHLLLYITQGGKRTIKPREDARNFTRRYAKKEGLFVFYPAYQDRVLLLTDHTEMCCGPCGYTLFFFVASTGRMETVSRHLLSSPPCPCYISKMFHSPLRANLKMSRKPVRNRGNSYIARSNYSGLVCRVKDEQAPRWGI